MRKKGMVIFNRFVYGLILLNVVAMIMESHQEIYVPYKSWFEKFELISVLVFSIEYIIRLVYNFNEGKVKGLFKYIFSFYGIVDLLSILPFYLNQLMTIDGRFLRILRLFRLTRIFKLGKESENIRIFVKALNSVKSELLFTLFLSFVLILFSSSAIYYLENEAQPEQFSSISASIWWAVATLTTVGYGDIYPITAGGKIFAGFIALVGVGIVAIPTGIISASFVEAVKEKNKGKE
jgi:voltage-gated potassium channel